MDFNTRVQKRLQGLLEGYNTREQAHAAAQKAAHTTGIRHWVLSDGSQYHIERHDQRSFSLGVPVASVDPPRKNENEEQQKEESTYEVRDLHLKHNIPMYIGPNEKSARRALQFLANRGFSCAMYVNGKLMDYFNYPDPIKNV